MEFRLIPAPGDDGSKYLLEKGMVIAILHRWKVAAEKNKKKEAAEACDRVLNFIRSICP